MFLGIGDFCEVAPVIRVGRKTDTNDVSIVWCPQWHSYSLLHVSEPICNASDPQSVQWVHNIGQGTGRIDYADISLNKIPDVYNIDDAIAVQYPPETLANPEQTICNSFLIPFNFYNDIFNHSMLNHVPNEQGLPQLQSSLFTLLTSFSYILQFRFDQRGRK